MYCASQGMVMVSLLRMMGVSSSPGMGISRFGAASEDGAGAVWACRGGAAPIRTEAAMARAMRKRISAGGLSFLAGRRPGAVGIRAARLDGFGGSEFVVPDLVRIAAR